MKIFISYRHADSATIVSRIYERLAAAFGESNVFRDINSIESGKEIPKSIQRALADSNIVLVVIGRDWVTISDKSGRRRLDDPSDWVLHEVRTALNTDEIETIPLLIDDTQMPSIYELPEALKNLPDRRGRQIGSSDEGFDADINKLIKDIRRRVPETHEDPTALPLLRREPRSSSPVKPSIHEETQPSLHPVKVPLPSSLPEPERSNRRGDTHKPQLSCLYVFVAFLLFGSLTAAVIFNNIANNIEFIYQILVDVSHTMQGDPGNRSQSRQLFLADIISGIISQSPTSGRFVGVRSAGGGEGNDCSKTELFIPGSGGTGNQQDLINRLQAIEPSGNTGYGASLEAAINDLQAFETGNPKVRFLFAFLSPDESAATCDDAFSLETALIDARRSNQNIKLCTFTFFESLEKFEGFKRTLPGDVRNCMSNIYSHTSAGDVIGTIQGIIRQIDEPTGTLTVSPGYTEPPTATFSVTPSPTQTPKPTLTPVPTLSLCQLADVNRDGRVTAGDMELYRTPPGVFQSRIGTPQPGMPSLYQRELDITPDGILSTSDIAVIQPLVTATPALSCATAQPLLPCQQADFNRNGIVDGEDGEMLKHLAQQSLRVGNVNYNALFDLVPNGIISTGDVDEFERLESECPKTN